MDNKNRKNWQEEGVMEKKDHKRHETHTEKKGAKAESTDTEEEGHRKKHAAAECGCKYF